jgi:hypothetical protein
MAQGAVISRVGLRAGARSLVLGFSLCGLGLLSACGTGSHLASHSSTTTEQPSSTTTIGRTSTTLSQAPSPQTQVETYNPWNPAGTLAGNVKVVSQISGTECTMESAFDVGNQYAWRCVQSSGGFYDPCFAPPGQSDVTHVACGGSPWSGVAIMTLSQPLAHSSWGTPKSAPNYAWAMALSNGQQCGVIEGTGSEIDGVGFNYGCIAGYATYPDTGTRLWTAKYAAGESGPVMSVTVTTAWA